jgi:hypothetical protein
MVDLIYFPKPEQSPEGMEDLKMMKNPDTWPLHPCLPFRNKEGKPGFIMDLDGYQWRMFQTNLFSFADSLKSISEVPFQQYDSPEAIVADGWEID